MKTKLTFLIIAAALAAATAGRAQTVISYSTDGGAQALETGSVRQTVLDTATLEVSYRMEWLRRPDREKPMQDLLLLQAGGKVTKFFSYKTLQRDSLLRITPTEQVLANVGNFKGGLEAVVFQNYPAGEMSCTDKISRDNMLYTEPLPESGRSKMSGISSVGMFSTSVTGRSSAENSSKKPDARSMEMPTISPSSVGNNFIAVCMPSAAPFVNSSNTGSPFTYPHMTVSAITPQTAAAPMPATIFETRGTSARRRAGCRMKQAKYAA